MKISVIVPVYNAEKYIKKCILSVIKQSYHNWELILVNDGSKDDSPEIIDMMTKKDDRIIAIHQKNFGPGEARNRGIVEATGDYVVFLDSDDYIDKDYFNLLIPKAKKNDIVFIDAYQVLLNGRVLCKELMSKYSKWSKDSIIRSQMTGKIPWGGWRKAVNLTLLKNNCIQFTSHDIGEEALYSFQVLYAAKAVAFLDEKPVYFYVNHKNSQSKLNLADPWGGSVKTLLVYLNKHGLYNKYVSTINAFNATATVVSLYRINQLYEGKELKQMAKDRINIFLNLYDKEEKIDLQSMNYKAKVFVPFLIRGWHTPILLCSRLKSLTT